MADHEQPKQVDDPVTYTDQPIHEVMRQQVADVLARADLSEQQKQQILIAIQCPCCGSGGLSFSIKLKD